MIVRWTLLTACLLLNLLFLLPLVALVPALEPWLTEKLDDPYRDSSSSYLLRLPAVKFGLECTADLTLALVLTLIPAADLTTAPVAPLLLVWVGSGLLWEARQLTACSSDAKSRLARMYDRLAAYWADSINRVDATALIFSFAALVAFVSTDNSEDATATSLRAVAVFLLWLRVIRMLLISPKFGPFVMMFFLMLFGDVLYFLVLLIFLLVAFAASWTVLLEPQSSIASCADELGGVDFHTTLLRLLEGALTGNDFFECARDSTSSPVAAWVITSVYVTLTAVLLLNMLIAMCAVATKPTAKSPLPRTRYCLAPALTFARHVPTHRMAKTFDNISEASATNYLFLFAQRTLALQNEPPTPPPLNVLGLPCEAVCLLLRLHKKEKGKGVVAQENDETAEKEEKATEELKVAATRATPTADMKARSSVGSWSFSTGSWSFASASVTEKMLSIEEAAVLEEGAVEVAAAGGINATEEKVAAAEKAAQADAKKESTLLAEKITEYILDHQDDAAQEDRWRTTMKRDMSKSFRKAETEMQAQREEKREEMQVLREEIHAMQGRFDDVLSKLDRFVVPPMLEVECHKR
jgi:hypothetical protein